MQPRFISEVTTRLLDELEKIYVLCTHDPHRKHRILKASSLAEINKRLHCYWLLGFGTRYTSTVPLGRGAWINSTPHSATLSFLCYHTHIMDGWVNTKNTFNQLTLWGNTNTDTSPTPGAPVVWSPAEDPILKYSKDPPALIACVKYPPQYLR